MSQKALTFYFKAFLNKRCKKLQKKLSIHENLRDCGRYVKSTDLIWRFIERFVASISQKRLPLIKSNRLLRRQDFETMSSNLRNLSLLLVDGIQI